jgi:hypothetical protein
MAFDSQIENEEAAFQHNPDGNPWPAKLKPITQTIARKAALIRLDAVCGCVLGGAGKTHMSRKSSG